MDIFLLILIGSTLVAMFLWSVHIDRRRAAKKLRDEEEKLVAGYKKWSAGGGKGRK